MAYDGLITSYLGKGTAAARPTTPNVTPTAIVFYFATDTGALSYWANGGWHGPNATGGSLGGSVTFNNSGSGASSGTAYDGTAPETVSYNTIGAQVAGSYLTANQTVTLSGDVTGSGATAITATLANTAVTAGSYTSANITVDAKGRVTAAANGAGGVGTVTTSGSPASGNLTKFSGSASVTNGDLSGDVTTSGSLAVTISAAAVTLSKMANLAANSILGNNTGSAATPIALTAAQTKTLLAIATTDVSGLGTAATHATGDFCQVANNLSDVTASTARTNLGLLRLIAFFFTTTPTNSEVLGLYIAADAFTIAANMSGSQVSIGTNPTATFAIDVQKNGSSIGTISISTSGVATLTTTSGTSKPISAGDVVKFVAPSTADATAANAAITIKGTL